MSHFTSFAVAGGSGLLGSQLVAGLLGAGAKRVLILSRSASTKVPSGAEVRVVDFDSVESVAKAVEGVDVLISALGGGAPAQEPVLARAAKAAGVKLYVPNEYGMDSSRFEAGIPVYYKKEVRDLLREIGQPALHVAVGAFAEVFFAPGALGFNFPERTAELVGSPDVYHSFTTTKDVGTFLGALLTTKTPHELTTLGDINIQGDRLQLKDLVPLYEASHPGTKLAVTRITLEEAKGQLEKSEGIAYFLKWLQVVWAQGWNDLTKGGEVQVANALVEGWEPTSVKDYLARL